MANGIYRVWLGIREAYSGYAGFVPVWELESATSVLDCSSPAISTASNGWVMRITPGTTTLANRLQISPYQVTGGNYEHFLGRYLVLLRARVSAGTWGVQLRYGFLGAPSCAPLEEIYISNTAWRLWEMGEVSIPPIRHGPADVRNFLIQVWAERTDGAGYLDLDALCLIPSRHFCYVEGTDLQPGGGDTNYLSLITAPNDEHAAIAYVTDGGPPGAGLKSVFRDWYLPLGSSVLVVAAERQHEHVLTDTLYWNYEERYSRWKSYRGS